MYLVQRHQTWWALHDIPRPLRKTLGRRLARSLETHDKPTATRLAAALWAHEWSRLLDRKATGKADEAEARFWARLVKEAKTDEEREHLIDHIATLAEDRHDRAKNDEGRAAALRFNRAAQGKLIATDEHIEEYLATLKDKAATIAAKRRVVSMFAEAFPYVQEVETKAVQAWLTNKTRQESLAAPTVERLLSFPRGYWRFLMDMGIADRDPLKDVRKPASATKVQSWEPFTPAEVVALHKAAKASGDTELADMIELGMWTGARIDELGSLKVEEVNLRARAFKITEAKTAAGVREVPIHSKLMPAMRRLIGKRSSGYVLERPRGTTETRRSKAIGERFGALKVKLGYDDRHVYHSIRKTVGTLLENAGVLENVAADLLGHTKPRITYNIYSGGASLEVKRAALEKLRYPGPRTRGEP